MKETDDASFFRYIFGQCSGPADTPKHLRGVH